MNINGKRIFLINVIEQCKLNKKKQPLNPALFPLPTVNQFPQ